MPPKPRRGLPCRLLPIGSTLICALLTSSDIARHAETGARGGGIGLAAHAPRRARLFRRTGPGTATHHALATPGVDPGLATARGTTIGVVPAIGDPFADIARHVVKTECIGRIASDRRRPPGAIVIAGERIAPVPATG